MTRRLLVLRGVLSSMLIGLSLTAVTLANAEANNTGGPSLGCTLRDCLAAVPNPLADSASYFRGALALLDGSLLRDSSLGYLVIQWPPGMYLVYAANEVASLPTTAYVALVVALWTVVLSLPSWLCARTGRYLSALSAALLIIALPPLSGWVLGQGLYFSEGLGIGLFLLSICCVMTAILRETSRMWVFAFSGASLAAAAYFRSVFDLVGISLVTLFLIWGAVSAIRLRTWRGTPAKLANWAVPYVLLTLPWRALVRLHIGPALTFNLNTEQVWRTNWMPASILDSFFVRYGLNGTCQAFPHECSRIASAELGFTSNVAYSGYGVFSASDFQRFTIEAILSDPSQWLASRLFFLISAIRESGEGGLLVFEPWGLGVLAAVSCALVVLRVALLGGLSTRKTLAVLVFGVSLIVPILPLFLHSFEPRYVHTAILLPVVLAVYSLSWPGSRSAIRRPSSIVT